MYVDGEEKMTGPESGTMNEMGKKSGWLTIYNELFEMNKKEGW